MKTIEIEVSFISKEGQQAKDSLSLTINDDDTHDKIMTWAFDLATEWFYDITNDAAMTLWNEKGGGTDYEFESFYEKYIETCNFQWNFKKNYLNAE